MSLETINWKTLERLRATFLKGAPGQPNYWRREEDLASYDATFAQRIGWKWDYVLRELCRRGWTPPKGDWFDWGCGSGIAGRAVVDCFGHPATRRLCLYDRAPVAMHFATQRAQAKYAGIRVTVGPCEKPALALASHVLTELAMPQVEALADDLARATAIIWVEPGTREASAKLIAIRERLRDRFEVVAPCTHQAACGLLVPGNEPHWCHHFAPSPPSIFTDPHWARFATLTGVDLRSLPVSFLVLDRRPVPSLPPGATRVLGWPRLYKGYARLLGCQADGVADRDLPQRQMPEEFRRLKKDLDPLQLWQVEGHRIVATAPLFGSAANRQPL